MVYIGDIIKLAKELNKVDSVDMKAMDEPKNQWFAISKDYPYKLLSDEDYYGQIEYLHGNLASTEELLAHHNFIPLNTKKGKLFRLITFIPRTYQKLVDPIIEKWRFRGYVDGAYWGGHKWIKPDDPEY